ncbi:Gfo/Idh/MocA family protein [Paenibacillus thalictri]|uniref:Gfo/Idh/MocA family oxidoreductase n=1 Tax=Paenibacillus thalictri TaxID=2527873 RepID=A0A4Q9DV79_9BACL|nr:Gfo/Idh/MocA family oxidoreductase [Paenibacillus thalictri]TBL80265.1 Gfo/Idh/MocA family oxidoreductase [Paenibacillus thalictri]
MVNNEQIRFGIIGAGNIAGVHIQTLAHIPEAAITAITDVYQPLAEQRAREHGIPVVHPSYEKLLEDPDVDAVIVAVPNKYHATIAVAALQAGKHVLLEKPMALNAAEAKKILLTHRQTNLTLMMAHQQRWEWSSLQVKEQVDKGALGHIYNAKTGWMRRKGIPGWGTWFTRMDQSGGGPLIDLGVHMIDLSLHLMGNPKPLTVFGTTFAEFGPKKRGIGTWGTPNWEGFYDVEDLSTALIKCDNGSTLSLDVSWAAHAEYMDGKPFVYLMGSEGGASLRDAKGMLFSEVDDQKHEVQLAVPENDEGSRVRMARHFIECVREGKEPLTSALSGYTNSLILEAIYESSRTGAAVTLEWDI